MCIAAAWDLAARKPTTMPIYNCTSGQLNSMSIQQFLVENAVNSSRKNPLSKSLPLLITKNNYLKFS